MTNSTKSSLGCRLSCKEAIGNAHKRESQTHALHAALALRRVAFSVRGRVKRTRGAEKIREWDRDGEKERATSERNGARLRNGDRATGQQGREGERGHVVFNSCR
ncbi:hypothetical protein PUN28_004473 [Cardiocondyla obscurior]|uniref:Uncharacterized protein n=1 Tax=Cardiocondyla obscurior TaxID=286306 RepID=A0AAW2GET6_9HYME